MCDIISGVRYQRRGSFTWCDQVTYGEVMTSSDVQRSSMKKNSLPLKERWTERWVLRLSRMCGIKQIHSSSWLFPDSKIPTRSWVKSWWQWEVFRKMFTSCPDSWDPIRQGKPHTVRGMSERGLINFRGRLFCNFIDILCWKKNMRHSICLCFGPSAGNQLSKTFTLTSGHISVHYVTQGW